MKKKESAKQQQSHDLIYGIHPLIELLKAKKRRVLQVYTTQPLPKAFGQIEKLLPKQTPITYAKKEALDRLADSTDHQNVIAAVTPLQLRKKAFDPAKQPFIVLLDSIQDTRNIGGILRSAYCTGAQGVIIPEKSCGPLSAATLKAAAGLAEHLELYRPSSAFQAAQEVKAAGYNLYMAALGGGDATQVEYQLPCCVVIGNEATGISSELLKLGQRITLPQKTADISYNASVAAGILLFLIATKTKVL